MLSCITNSSIRGGGGGGVGGLYHCFETKLINLYNFKIKTAITESMHSSPLDVSSCY